tara:strand:+ start:890 stop:1108 length:219 start_codon:yes stop_codon:yes gene_type:complete
MPANFPHEEIKIVKKGNEFLLEIDGEDYGSSLSIKGIEVSSIDGNPDIPTVTITLYTRSVSLENEFVGSRII